MLSKSSEARYMAIKDCDILQSDGLSVSVWFAGCPFRCKGCHNQQTWSMESGKVFDMAAISKIEELLNNKNIRSLSILGGEPLLVRNYEILETIIDIAKKLNKEVWIWTGFLLEEVEHLGFMKNVDYVIDGQYIEELRTPNRYKGSSNQRVIRMSDRKIVS